ncbi:MAG TPA: Coenzyme F420 hydrogenase/dehydrogenase, beta subunit C-terminal domain [Candidatus Rifleibacterium sp.]|nr:Coenzyme F420 hydrogenase/dehydrogenase, beta subunit C-terminal domain [Candidatus Rifleibacterium sp.]HPT46735.1 Coenzyme F420 hydrogenase/dehydrogenase, beta subunit C-terminal domain [Candidatus Rifleibacterium sp.]
MNIFSHDLIEAHSCCGCGACAVACKFKAINLQLNLEGFFEPRLDPGKCTHCGRCLQVCFKFLGKSDRITDFKQAVLFSAVSKDASVVSSCSSGGVAFELSRAALDDGRKVLGAIYDADNHKVVTRIASEKTELGAMRGSKYLQSYTPDAFLASLNDVDNKYLFVGTPCQIYGMRKLCELEGQVDRYTFVDFFCHGVPSYLVWQRHLSDTMKSRPNERLLSVGFRSKKFGWHSFCLEFCFSSGSLFQKENTSNFYKIFFDDVMLARSCYTCSICKRFGFSDLRIGDYWGAKYDENDTGVSIVAAPSDFGQKILTSIRDRVVMQNESFTDNSAFLTNSNNYKIDEAIRKKIVEDISKGLSLSAIVDTYYALFPTKTRIGKKLRFLFSLLPAKVLKKIRKIYHRMRD